MYIFLYVLDSYKSTIYIILTNTNLYVTSSLFCPCVYCGIFFFIFLLEYIYFHRNIFIVFMCEIVMSMRGREGQKTLNMKDGRNGNVARVEKGEESELLSTRIPNIGKISNTDEKSWR